MFYNNNQMNINRIDDQMRQLQQLKNQCMQQPMIQQNFVQNSFQSDFDSKWVDNIEEVKNISINRDTIFMNRNEPVFYIKSNTDGIKSYSFTEIIEVDEKELKIQSQQQEIENLKLEIEKIKEEFNNGKSDISKPKSKSTINDTKV